MQGLSALEHLHPAADSDRIDEKIEFVDKVVLDERRHERRAAVDDEVAPGLPLQPGFYEVSNPATFGIPTIFFANGCSGLSGFATTCSQ